jgi:hypothetical protein
MKLLKKPKLDVTNYFDSDDETCNNKNCIVFNYDIREDDSDDAVFNYDICEDDNHNTVKNITSFKKSHLNKELPSQYKIIKEKIISIYDNNNLLIGTNSTKVETFIEPCNVLYKNIIKKVLPVKKDNILLQKTPDENKIDKQLEKGVGHYNKGKPWTEKEEDQLRKELKDKVSCNDIAMLHGRTKGGISARIKKMILKEYKYCKDVKIIANKLFLTEAAVNKAINFSG